MFITPVFRIIPGTVNEQIDGSEWSWDLNLYWVWGILKTTSDMLTFHLLFCNLPNVPPSLPLSLSPPFPTHGYIIWLFPTHCSGFGCLNTLLEKVSLFFWKIQIQEDKNKTKHLLSPICLKPAIFLHFLNSLGSYNHYQVSSQNSAWLRWIFRSQD